MLANTEEKLVFDFLEEHKNEDKNNSTQNWKLLITEEEINTINDYVAKVINTKFVGKNIVIASILKGAVYFTVDLTRRLTIPYSLYFIEASSYPNRGFGRDNYLNKTAEVNLAVLFR